jgi:Protein phosphatase 2C
MPLLARDGLQLHYPGQRRRRRQQHEQQKSSRTRTFIVFIVIPVLLAAWCIGTVILLVSRDTGQQQQQQQPSVDSDSPLIRRREKSDAAASDDCEIYGCPIYPPEIDDVIVNETLLEDSKMQLVHDHDPSALAADATSSSRRMAFHSFATTTHATITRQSNQHEFNQDKSVIFTPFLTLQTPRGTKSFLVAIFDGHGVLGHLMADHVRHQVPTVLANKLNARPCCQSSAWIAQQLNDTFLEVNQHVTPSAYALRGGCTASVSLRIGNRLVVANAGDSRTILVKYSYYNSKKDDDNSQMMQEGEEYAPPIQEPLGKWTMGNTTMENGIVQDIPFQSK